MVSMCRRVRTPELFKHVGERVTLAGWLHARRTLGGVAFYLVRDGWGMCQVVCEGDSKPPEIPVESIVRVEGLLVREEKAPGGFELRDPRWHIEQPAEPPPFTLGKRELKLSSPMALDFAPIVLRYPARRALHRLSALVMESFRKTLRSLAFTEISTPKIIGECKRRRRRSLRPRLLRQARLSRPESSTLQADDGGGLRKSL